MTFCFAQANLRIRGPKANPVAVLSRKSGQPNKRASQEVGSPACRGVASADYESVLNRRLMIYKEVVVRRPCI